VSTIEYWIAAKPTAGSSNRTAPVWNPATVQQAEVVQASREDVVQAIEAAKYAFPGWSQTSQSKRSKILFAFRELVSRYAEEIAALSAARPPAGSSMGSRSA
jgi:malonate-semialdehyde dehydrogenase (acetylating)/methylmalonate-semialdehyde dehydrogenase